MRADGNSRTCVLKSLAHSQHFCMCVRGYTYGMYHVQTYNYHDLSNKRQRPPAQITFHRKFMISKDHMTRTTAYSDEKEPKRREREQERNETEREKRKTFTKK